MTILTAQQNSSENGPSRANADARMAWEGNHPADTTDPKLLTHIVRVAQPCSVDSWPQNVGGIIRVTEKHWLALSRFLELIEIQKP